MLAFIFWHWPERPDTYEADLIAFHEALRAAHVDGCIANATYRIGGLPWITASPAYEDWYLVDGFADLGTLNEAAVSPALRPAHDASAHAAAAGTGGLYGLVSGDPNLDAPVASWLSKPRGMPYPDYYDSLPRTTSLFRRQLTLGPGLEFLALDAVLGALQIRRERLC